MLRNLFCRQFGKTLSDVMLHSLVTVERTLDNDKKLFLLPNLLIITII